MKFQDCSSMNSTENIQEGYRYGLSKTALEFENCTLELFTLTMYLPACLWAQIARTPLTITARTPLANVMTINFRDVHHNPSIKFASSC